MDFKEMTVDQLEERKVQIGLEVDTPEADLDALENELRSIKEELERRKTEETKKADIRAAVAAGEGAVVQKFESEERKMPDINEIRSSKEYAERSYAAT